MHTLIQPLRSPSLERLTPDDSAILLANARQLQRASAASQAGLLLRGKKLALLCEFDDAADAVLFRAAAAGLGAHVAHVRPSLAELSEPRSFEHTARVLGRLYDAIECQGMDAELVRRLGEQAGVPVYAALASPGHASAALAPLLADPALPPADGRTLVLQAALLSTIL